MAGRDILKIVCAEGEGQNIGFEAKAAEHLPAPNFIAMENAFQVQLSSSLPLAGPSRWVNSMKNGWIKPYSSGRGTFYIIDYGQEAIEPK